MFNSPQLFRYFLVKVYLSYQTLTLKKQTVNKNLQPHIEQNLSLLTTLLTYNMNTQNKQMLLGRLICWQIEVFCVPQSFMFMWCLSVRPCFETQIVSVAELRSCRSVSYVLSLNPTTIRGKLAMWRYREKKCRSAYCGMRIIQSTRRLKC